MVELTAVASEGSVDAEAAADLIWQVGLYALGVASAGHALLHKRGARPAAMWVAVCLLLPGFGPLLYVTFGYNRVSTRANALRRRWTTLREHDVPVGSGSPPDLPASLAAFAEIGARITGSPLRPGHRVRLLRNASEAYPPMLEAIEAARSHILLGSYIFDRDEDGLVFARALARAVERGVEVKVLIDGLGEWYSPRRIGGVLRSAGVETQRFLAPSLFPPSLLVNLRYHRKLLVVDGERGFTGGMNIGSRHRVEGERGVRDLQFEVRGPVVEEMELQFREDWGFATGAEPRPPLPPRAQPAPPGGDSWVRAVASGPNEDLERVRWILLGALSRAKRRVRIMTPYFIAEAGLVAALNSAALRGVEVEIVLPARNNLIYMSWAADAQLWQILSFGVRVFRQQGAFDHTKLVVIDDGWALIGSSNLDPRSLRLNFEFNLEVLGGAVVEELDRHFEQAREGAAELSEEELAARPLWRRLRDAAAALFSPYL